MCRHTDGPWQLANAFISNKNALKWKCIFCCAINGLFSKSNLSSILCASNVFIVSVFGTFDVVHLISMGVYYFRLQHFRRKQRNFVKFGTKAEANEKKAARSTRLHARTKQMDSNVRVDVAGIFPTFQAVGTSWLAFAISIVRCAKSEKPLTVCECVYVLLCIGWEKCFSEGEILLIFRFFAHHHFVLVAFHPIRTRTHTSISPLPDCSVYTHLGMVANFSCLFSRCVCSRTA